MVEEVGGANEKVVGIQDPAFERDGQAELVLFIAFAGQRCEIQLLLVLDSVQGRPRKRAKGRRLIKMAVKAAENPMKFGNLHGSAYARARGVLGEFAGKMRLAEPGVQREPGSWLELVLDKCGNQAASGTLPLGEIAAVGIKHAEELIVLLRETVKAHPRVVASFNPGNIRLATFVL